LSIYIMRFAWGSSFLPPSFWAWYYRCMSEDENEVIDKYVLQFLDEFTSTFGHLPDEKEFGLWKIGFTDGCDAVREALEKRERDLF